MDTRRDLQRKIREFKKQGLSVIDGRLSNSVLRAELQRINSILDSPNLPPEILAEIARQDPNAYHSLLNVPRFTRSKDYSRIRAETKKNLVDEFWGLKVTPRFFYEQLIDNLLYSSQEEAIQFYENPVDRLTYEYYEEFSSHQEDQRLLSRNSDNVFYFKIAPDRMNEYIQFNPDDRYLFTTWNQLREDLSEEDFQVVQNDLMIQDYLEDIKFQEELREHSIEKIAPDDIVLPVMRAELFSVYLNLKKTGYYSHDRYIDEPVRVVFGTMKYLKRFDGRVSSKIKFNYQTNQLFDAIFLLPNEYQNYSEEEHGPDSELERLWTLPD